jgi:hypothetical protein
MQWVSGYINGFNQYRSSVDETTKSALGKDRDWEFIELWLENYCRANPAEYLGAATKALVEELIKRESK